MTARRRTDAFLLTFVMTKQLLLMVEGTSGWCWLKYQGFWYLAVETKDSWTGLKVGLCSKGKRLFWNQKKCELFGEVAMVLFLRTSKRCLTNDFGLYAASTQKSYPKTI